MGSAEVDDDDTPPEIDVVLPDADPVLRARGYRLHVFKDGASLLIANERVHPEQVSNPHAQAILESKRLWVHPTSMGWLRDQLETVLGKQRVPLTELQAESARTNEANGVIAFLVGVIEEVALAPTKEDAKTLVTMARQSIDEWQAGLWNPGPHDDPAFWRRLKP